MAKKNNLNINDLSTWPMALTLFFCVVIIALFVYIMKVLLVDNVSNQIRSQNSKITKEEEAYAKNKKIITMLPYVRKEVEQLVEARDKAKEYLPTQVSMPSLIDNVYVAARNNGIVFNQFTPEKDIEEEYYIIKPVSLEASVGYGSMSSFIEEVTTLKRIMNVDSVSFRAKEDLDSYRSANTPLIMTAQLRTYIFKEGLLDGEEK